MKVFKYELKITDEQVIDLPIFARCLKIDTQIGDDGKERLFMWCLVNEQSEATAKITIFVHGTGHLVATIPHTELPNSKRVEPWFLETALMKTLPAVWHVFADYPLKG